MFFKFAWVRFLNRLWYCVVQFARQKKLFPVHFQFLEKSKDRVVELAGASVTSALIIPAQ